MPLPDRVSYSSWQSYRRGCQWKWKLDVVDGLRSNAYGVHLDFGTCIHNAIEKYKTKKDPISMEDAQKSFEEKFRDLFGKNKEKYKESERSADLEELVSAGKRIIESLDKCGELASAEVVYNEHELLLPISRTDDVKMNFKGFIDMVIKSKDGRGKDVLYVIDFKTCSWGWGKEKRDDDDLKYQLFLYKHFLSKKFNLDPKFVRTAFILLKKSPPKGADVVEFFPVSAGPVSVQRALDALNADISDMKERTENNTLIKNRQMCTSKFGDVCPYLNTEHCKND